MLCGDLYNAPLQVPNMTRPESPDSHQRGEPLHVHSFQRRPAVWIPAGARSAQHCAPCPIPREDDGIALRRAGGVLAEDAWRDASVLQAQTRVVAADARLARHGDRCPRLRGEVAAIGVRAAVGAGVPESHVLHERLECMHAPVRTHGEADLSAGHDAKPAGRIRAIGIVAGGGVFAYGNVRFAHGQAARWCAPSSTRDATAVTDEMASGTEQCTSGVPRMEAWLRSSIAARHWDRTYGTASRPGRHMRTSCEVVPEHLRSLSVED